MTVQSTVKTRLGVEPYRYTPATTPEANRRIKCQCFDWSDYTMEGMFVPYKKGSGKRTGHLRFMRHDPSGLVADRAGWKDVEHWEYAEETK